MCMIWGGNKKLSKVNRKGNNVIELGRCCFKKEQIAQNWQ